MQMQTEANHRFNPLAEAFAQQCRTWSAQAGANTELQLKIGRIASMLVTAVGEGHLCLDLTTVGNDCLLTPEDGLATGIVRLANARGTAPMVLDGQRLYLTRHYHAELSTAQALSAMAESGRLCIISGGPGTGKTTTVARLLGRLLAAKPHTKVVLAAPTGKAAARMMEALQTRATMLPEQLRALLPKTASTLHRLLGWHPQRQKPKHHSDNPLWLDILIVDEASMLDQTLAAQLLDALPPTATLVLLGDKDQLAAVEAGAVFAEISDVPGCLPSDTAALDAWLDDILGLGMSPAMRQLVTEARIAAQEAARKAAERHAKKRQAMADRQQDLFGDLPLPPLRQIAVESSPNHQRRLQDCVVWLQTSHRFKADSALGRVATAVREGDVAKALHALLQASKAADNPSTDCAWLAEEGAGLSATAQAWLLAGYLPYQKALLAWFEQKKSAMCVGELFAAFDRFRILSAIHGGPRGVQAINRLLNDTRVHWLRDQPAVIAEWAGQAILILQNDAATGLFNGDVGLVLPSEAGIPEVWFAAGNTYRAVPLVGLPKHDMAYAMTVHKSQGSEFDRVALVLPHEESPLLTRELVYTGLTRARHGVAVLAATDVLGSAIAHATQRDTGLGERLRSE
jgi:exodeoxyribonuclease V alpha subunit